MEVFARHGRECPPTQVMDRLVARTAERALARRERGSSARREREMNRDAEYVRSVPQPGVVAAEVLSNVANEVPQSDTGYVECCVCLHRIVC